MRGLVLAGCLGLSAGCALRAPGPRLPAPVDARALIAVLDARRGAVQSLRARARLRGVAGMWTREALLVRRPDLIRIDVLSPLGVAYALGMHGTRLWAYPARQNTRYEGEATPAEITRFLGAPVAVADVVDALLGVPPARIPTGAAEASVTPEGAYRLTLPLVHGVQSIWFDAGTRAVRQAEETRGSTLALRLAYGDYQDGFPRTLALEAPASGASVQLVYTAVETNVRLDPALFDPPAAEHVLPLAAAMPPDAEE